MEDIAVQPFNPGREAQLHDPMSRSLPEAQVGLNRQIPTGSALRCQAMAKLVAMREPPILQPVGHPMKIKDILLPLTSYPIATEARSIENAVVLAKRMGAQMSAIAFAMDIESLVGLFADPIGVSGILAADRKKSADNASDILSLRGTRPGKT